MMQQFGVRVRKIAAATARSSLQWNLVAAPLKHASPGDGLRRSFVTATKAQWFPMKAGTQLKELAVFKGQDAPVTMERSEYPDWINHLAKPQPSLAALRKIPNEEAELHEIKRYLKLTRRQAVRQRNEESEA